MIEVSLTEARARLPELLTRVSEGEEVHILRHGKRVAALIDHDRWVKTQQHDVLIQAREIGLARQSLRGQPWPPPGFEPSTTWDAEAHIADIREARDRDPWGDVVE